MHYRHRTSILLLILLGIMSGLYIINRLSNPQIEQDVPIVKAFDGKVPSEIVRGNTSKKQIIFTFDAGSGDVSVVPILEVLKKHSVKGTFFMTGKWALRHQELVHRIVAEGHEIFNHSYDHPHLPTLVDADIAAQLNNTDSVLEGLAGTSTKPYFRPPYGDRDERVLHIAAQAGYQSVYWTIDAQDWMESEGMTAGEVSYRILANLEPGMIILMHVGDTITGQILDGVFTAIEQRGYRIVSLSQGI